MAKLLVTGGAGFIGSHLTRELVHRGHTVTVLDNFFTGKREHLTDILNDITLLEGDIRDYALLESNFRGFDTIFHQAALRSVPASFDDPAAYAAVNVTGTKNVLTAAIYAGIRRVVFASSSSVYGDSPLLPQREDILGKQLSPYAETKFIGEQLCTHFHQHYGLQTVALRYFNVFGPHQDPHSKYAAVIPLFILALLRDQQPTIFGDGTQTRDFTYVTNVVYANLQAMNLATPVGKAINVANGECTSINELFETIRKFLNKPISPHYMPERHGDIKHTKADTTRAQQLLNYQPGTPPLVSFKDGIEKTTEWYHEQYR